MPFTQLRYNYLFGDVQPMHKGAERDLLEEDVQPVVAEHSAPLQEQ